MTFIAHPIVRGLWCLFVASWILYTGEGKVLIPALLMGAMGLEDFSLVAAFHLFLYGYSSFSGFSSSSPSTPSPPCVCVPQT